MFELCSIFKDGVILQRDKEIRITGFSEGNTNVKIEIKSGNKILVSGETTVSDNCLSYDENLNDTEGMFVVRLDALSAGGPYKIVAQQIKGKIQTEKIVVNDVYVGELWLAGGEDNMAMSFYRTEDSRNVILDYEGKNISYFKLSEDDDETCWTEVSTKTLGNMSGLAFYFAQKLQERINCKIGVVECTYPMSSVMCWQSIDTLLSTETGKIFYKKFCDAHSSYTEQELEEEMSQYYDTVVEYEERFNEMVQLDPYCSARDVFEKIGDVPSLPPITEDSIRFPGKLYELLLKKLFNISFRGVIFYQGESDIDDRSEAYSELFISMINDWRKLLDDSELPFIYAQLPMYTSRDNLFLGYDNMHLPQLRDEQHKVSLNQKQCYMVVMTDLGEFNNRLPINKKTPGIRFALHALGHVYKYSKYKSDSPYIVDIRKQKCAVEISFDGKFDMLTLNTKDFNDTGFEIAGVDGAFYKANASVDFDGKTVLLECTKVLEPVKVRYAYFSYGNAMLHTETGIAIPPFEMMIGKRINTYY